MKTRRWGIGVVLLVVLAVGGWLYFTRTRSAPPQPVIVMPPEPTTRILFIGEENGATGIFTINPDGSGRRLLAPIDDFAREDQFTVSADGRWLGYLGKDYSINVREIDDDTVHRLDFPKLTDIFDRPAVSPDGRAVVFSGNRVLQRANSDGTNLRRLTTPEKDYIDIAPQFSPDGARIAYVHAVANSGAGGAVCVINRDGSGKRVLDGFGYFNGLRWSRDARYLAADAQEESEELAGVTAVFDLTNGTKTLLKDAVYPAFSPVENLLAVYDIKADAITLMRPDGRDRRAVPNTGGLTIPVFSPDGQSLLLTRWDKTAYDNATLVIINRDGAGRRELTKGRYPLYHHREGRASHALSSSRRCCQQRTPAPRSGWPNQLPAQNFGTWLQFPFPV